MCLARLGQAFRLCCPSRRLVPPGQSEYLEPDRRDELVRPLTIRAFASAAAEKSRIRTRPHLREFLALGIGRYRALPAATQNRQSRVLFLLDSSRGRWPCPCLVHAATARYPKGCNSALSRFGPCVELREVKRG